ncbi:MAG: hypothetical protein HKN47_19185 [Pirellulaceae bacterium]|nr:hypothetical protein [Pirellulaceae bacterium]
MSGTEAATQTRPSGHFSRWVFVALLLAATLFIIRTVGPQTIGEQARRQFEKQLRDHYVGYEVSVGKGRYEPSVGLIFEDLRIADPHVPVKKSNWGLTSSESREMIRVEKLTVVASTEPEKLLEKKNPLVTRRVVLDGVHVDAWMTADDKLSLEQLWPMPKFGPAAPRVEIHRAHLRLVDVSGSTQPIELELSHLLLVNGAKINSSQVPPGGSDTSPTTTIGQTISLRGSANFASSIQVEAHASDAGLKIRGLIKNARISAELIDRLPSRFREPLQQARGLSCLCDAAFEIGQTPGNPIDYRLKATVHDGRLDHPSLPEPISKLSGVLVCDRTGIKIDASQGIFGDAVCYMSGSVGNYQWPQSAQFTVNVKGLSLNDRLARSIPPSLQQGWDRLRPSGRVDIVDASIFNVGGLWKANATVDCKGVDVRYSKFPYPVEQLVGRVQIRNDIATSQLLTGRIGGRRLQCGFRLPTKPGVTNEKVFVVNTDGPIAIDSTLIRSLTHRGSQTSKLESFVRSLQPRGSVHLTNARLMTDAGGNNTREFDLHVADGHLRYKEFAYPLYNVTGKIHVRNDLVTLDGFHGTNANAGQIQCNGTYKMPTAQDAASTGLTRLTPPGATVPTAQAADQSDLRLHFHATNIPVDESLRTSVPIETRRAWDAISPSGVLDELDVTVAKRGPGRSIGLTITATETESHQLNNRTLSIQPSSLPYRLDIIDGQVRYDGRRVTIESLRTRHDATHIAAHGGCVQDPNGRWRLMLNIHSGSRISPDAELIASLPKQMKEAMHRLQLRRPVSVRGTTEFLLPQQSGGSPIIDWDLVLQLEGNRIGDIGPVHALRGELSARGTSDAAGLRTDGDVRIDSMHVNDLQVTAIRGPYSIRDDRLLLGTLAQSGLKPTVTPIPTLESADLKQPPTRTQPVTYAPDDLTRKIRGKLFGGELQLTGEVVLSSAGFKVDAALVNGKVPTLLADLGHGRNELTGVVDGQIELEGILGTTDLLKGIGSARVQGANLYQLPLLVQLLNLLRITPAEDVAFTDAELEFTLIENQLNFNDLKLWGDLVALQGGGTLDRKRELDLTLNTWVSPQNIFTKVLGPLRSQEHTLWTVDVRGPLGDPTVERRAFDGVNQTLEWFFPTMNQREPATPPKTRSGRRSYFQ